MVGAFMEHRAAYATRRRHAGLDISRCRLDISRRLTLLTGCRDTALSSPVRLVMPMGRETPQS